MDIKTLEELQAADEPTLIFTPLGLGRMTPEGAADFQQRVIARLQLGDDVAESTRNRFEQLRTAYRHGVLCYELFTLVGEAAQLTLEQALRDRFAAHYHGQVVELRDRREREHRVAMTSFSDFFDELRKIRNPELRWGPRWRGSRSTACSEGCSGGRVGKGRITLTPRLRLAGRSLTLRRSSAICGVTRRQEAGCIRRRLHVILPPETRHFSGGSRSDRSKAGGQMAHGCRHGVRQRDRVDKDVTHDAGTEGVAAVPMRVQAKRNDREARAGTGGESQRPVARERV